MEELALQLHDNHWYEDTTYLTQTAKNKRDLLWNQINQDHTPSSYPVLKLTEFFVESMDPTFHTQGDALPDQKIAGFISVKREKLIHCVAGHGLV